MGKRQKRRKLKKEDVKYNTNRVIVIRLMKRLKRGLRNYKVEMRYISKSRLLMKYMILLIICLGAEAYSFTNDISLNRYVNYTETFRSQYATDEYWSMTKGDLNKIRQYGEFRIEKTLARIEFHRVISSGNNRSSRSLIRRKSKSKICDLRFTGYNDEIMLFRYSTKIKKHTPNFISIPSQKGEEFYIYYIIGGDDYIAYTVDNVLAENAVEYFENLK